MASGQSKAYRMPAKPYMMLYDCQIILGRKTAPPAMPITQPSTGGAACVEEILHQDRAICIAQCLQNACLRPLLIDHEGHRRNADQRSHGEEKQREHRGYGAHDVRIALKAGVADVAAAVEDKDIRVFELFASSSSPS